MVRSCGGLSGLQFGMLRSMMAADVKQEDEASLLECEPSKMTHYPTMTPRNPTAKGTVSLDFFDLGFIMDLFHIGPKFRDRKDFGFCFVFAKLFEFFEDSPL
jgi:hypothetical protein